jgi:hypothetical protein
MSSIARSARELHRKSLEIKRLKQQARAHQMNLESAMKTICTLTDQLSDSYRAKAEIDPITSPADCIFHDLLQTRQREISGRCYSRKTMMWARHVYDISPNAISVSTIKTDPFNLILVRLQWNRVAIRKSRGGFS